jgi:uncharacterized protein (DUF433 family)
VIGGAMMAKAMDLVEINPNICSGKPVIRGTRIMVRNIPGMVAGGYTVDKILESYPELTREAVEGALACAADVIDEMQESLPDEFALSTGSECGPRGHLWVASGAPRVDRSARSRGGVVGRRR